MLAELYSYGWYLLYTGIAMVTDAPMGIEVLCLKREETLSQLASQETSNLRSQIGMWNLVQRLFILLILSHRPQEGSIMLHLNCIVISLDLLCNSIHPDSYQQLICAI